MNMPQIRLESRQAQIDISSIPAQQSIEQPGPELDLQQPPAEMHIDRTPSKLNIDQSQAWADMDLKPISARIKEAAQKGYQDWLDGLARRSEDGEEMMSIENGGNAVASIAKRNSEPPYYNVNIGFIPSEGSVKIQYDPGRVNIQWELHKPINNSKARKPIIEYQPGKVDIKLKQYQDLKIDFTNLKYVGINYELEI